VDDDDLDSFVDALVRRLASFDRETLAAAKAQINRFGTPTATELKSSNDMFFSTLAQPGAQARRAKVRGIGYGAPSDFELNFGRYLPTLGRADPDDMGTQPDSSWLLQTPLLASPRLMPGAPTASNGSFGEVISTYGTSACGRKRPSNSRD
jgi:hypothetical protein